MPRTTKSSSSRPPHFRRCQRPGEFVWKICVFEEGIVLPVIDYMPTIGKIPANKENVNNEGEVLTFVFARRRAAS
jgi:hypothetical protein